MSSGPLVLALVGCFAGLLVPGGCVGWIDNTYIAAFDALEQGDDGGLKFRMWIDGGGREAVLSVELQIRLVHAENAGDAEAQWEKSMMIEQPRNPDGSRRFVSDRDVQVSPSVVVVQYRALLRTQDKGEVRVPNVLEYYEHVIEKP